MRYIIIGLVLGSAIYFIMKVILQFKVGISGTRSMVQKDFKTLEDLVDQYSLSPWHQKEIDILSRHHDVSSQSHIYATIEHGQFYSIYHEPIMAFASKIYDQNERTLVVLKINDAKYQFDIHNGHVDMRKNGRAGGQVTYTTGLEIQMNNHTLEIDAQSRTGLIPLRIDGHHKISIASSDDTTGSAGRMLHKVHEHTPEESELILVSLAYALATKEI